MSLPEEEDSWALVMRETTDPEVRLRLLAFRVSVLTREKEGLEKRLRRIELAYLAGQGIFWTVPIVGAVVAFFWANWEWISRPWMKHGGG